MASSFAGVKAGILSGIFLAGVLGALDYATFYIFKSSVLGILGAFPECSGGTAATSEECFDSLIAVSIPVSMFTIFLVSLVFAVIFGRYFEALPRRSYFVKALFVSYAMLFVFYIVLSGFALAIIPGFISLGYDSISHALVVGLVFAITVAYAYLLAAFYKRYTRVVEFSSPDAAPVMVMLGGRRDVTGKSVTLASKSSYKVVGETSGNRVFKEWKFSGGVTIEDPKSYETVMRVEGNGTLSAYSVPM